MTIENPAVQLSATAAELEVIKAQAQLRPQPTADQMMEGAATQYEMGGVSEPVSAIAAQADALAAGLRATTAPPVAPPPPGAYPAPQPPQVPGYAAPMQPGYPVQVVPQPIPVGQPLGHLPAMPPPPPLGVAPGSLANPNFNPAAVPQGQLDTHPVGSDGMGGPAYQPTPQYAPQTPAYQGFAPAPQAPPAFVNPDTELVRRAITPMDTYNRLGYACDLITRMYGEMRSKGYHKNAPTMVVANDFLAECGRGRLS